MSVIPLHQRGYTNPQLLAETHWLAEHMDDPNVRIVDARPPQQYDAGHISGAVSLGNQIRRWKTDIGRSSMSAILKEELSLISLIEKISKSSRRRFMTDKCLVKNLSFRVHHTMLPVADLDRSVAFYTRLLGMKVKERHAAKHATWKSVWSATVTRQARRSSN